MTDYHVPVLLKESVDGLDIKPDGIYVDVTFGGGGHSREIISRLTTGRLIAFDQDEDAKANIIDDERFILIDKNFRFLGNFLRHHGIDQVDGVLADLGVSSHHFDAAERGFSFMYDADLDMRMHQGDKMTAATVLNTYSEEELARVFYEFGELKNARKLARIITGGAANDQIKTIEQFKKLIELCAPKFSEHKYFAKVFQALRIEVNDEINALKEFLLQTTNVIKKGGRLSVITYHSLEDRLVKNFVRAGKFKGAVEKDFYGNPIVPFESAIKKIIIPTPEEIEVNSRARSAKLRIAERV